MIEVTSTLFAGRTATGGVRLVSFTSAPLSAPVDEDAPGSIAGGVDLNLTETQWAQLVAQLSLRGAGSHRDLIAKAFHSNSEPLCRFELP